MIDFKKYLWVLPISEFNGTTYSYIDETGKDPFTGKTADDYRAEGHKVVTDAEFDILLKQYENSMTGQWSEITADQYEYAMNVLPPAKWEDGGFFNPEAYCGNVYSFYQEINGKFYQSLQNIMTPRENIMESLRCYLSA